MTLRPPLVGKVRSFHQRRIALPVGPEDLVLDVGSGDKPSWRADVLLDGYPEAAYDGQRSGLGAIRTPRPLFAADAADMPFADKVFDYAICSHVLEHVPDPAAVVGELTRVAKAGYIEVPEASAAKLVDFPTHLWWCRKEGPESDPTLVLTAKTQPHFDAEIAAYLQRAGLERRLERLLESRFEHNVVQLRWQGTVSCRVEGTLDAQFLRRTLESGAPHHGGRGLAGRVLTRAFTGRGHRSRPLRLDDLVKPGLRTGTGEVLQPRIYRLGT